MEALLAAEVALQQQLDALDAVVVSASEDDASLILGVQCHLQRAVDLLVDSHMLQPKSVIAVDADIKRILNREHRGFR